MKGLIGTLALKVLFDVQNEVDINDVDGDQQLRTCVFFVVSDQPLSVVPVRMVGVIDRTLPGMAWWDWFRRISPRGGTGLGLCFTSAFFCRRASFAASISARHFSSPAPPCSAGAL